MAQADHPFHGPARLRSKSLQKFYNILNHLVRSYYPFSPPLDRMHVKFLLSIFTAKCEELVTDCELRVHNCTSFGYNTRLMRRARRGYAVTRTVSSQASRSHLMKSTSHAMDAMLVGFGRSAAAASQNAPKRIIASIATRPLPPGSAGRRRTASMSMSTRRSAITIWPTPTSSRRSSRQPKASMVQ